MDACLYTIEANNLEAIHETEKQQAITSLEAGQVIYLPLYSFTPTSAEENLLSETVLSPKHKNISYDYSRKTVAGLADPEGTFAMQNFMHRFAMFSKQLIDTILPQYKESLLWGRTSYRPAEIKGRKSSKRKDDTRLHVDSFPATPVHGLRILRVFCNVNPYGEPRLWQLGEPFSQVLAKFSTQIPPFNRSLAKLLKWAKVTKTLRSPYDHYMLNLHDRMKLDDHYQQTVYKHCVNFPAQSTWLVFTDHVSHAALGGQFLMEQTFYLPVAAMVEPAFSPLKQWEKEKAAAMV